MPDLNSLKRFRAATIVPVATKPPPLTCADNTIKPQVTTTAWGESKVAIECVKEVVLKSKHLLHFEDLFQEGWICDGVDSSFDPYVDFKKVENLQLLEVIVVRHFRIEVVIVVKRLFFSKLVLPRFVVFLRSLEEDMNKTLGVKNGRDEEKMGMKKEEDEWFKNCMYRVTVQVRRWQISLLRGIGQVVAGQIMGVRRHWRVSITRENNRILEEILRTLEANSLVDVKEPEGSDDYMKVTYDKEQCLSDHYTAPVTPPALAYTPTLPVLATMEPLDTFLMGDEVIITFPERENDEFIKSSVDDLVPIPRDSELTLDSTDLECSMPIDPPLPCTDVLGDTIVDIDLLLGKHLDTLSMGDREVDFNPSRDIEELERLLADDPVPVLRVFDEPLGNSDSVPRSYDVTFSNPLFDFNDDFTLCNDNPLFDEEFKDISRLDPLELTPVIDESTLLVTLPLPCTNVLGDAIVDIDLLLGEHLDTLSTGDKEIDFNLSRDIEELERLLADDPIPVPRVFDEPLGNSDSMSRSSETSELFEELIAEFGLDDSIPTELMIGITTQRVTFYILNNCLMKIHLQMYL
ncbi:hypothetical protein Tco_0900720 [Tanacetum coccineum]